MKETVLNRNVHVFEVFRLSFITLPSSLCLQYLFYLSFLPVTGDNE